MQQNEIPDESKCDREETRREEINVNIELEEQANGKKCRTLAGCGPLSGVLVCVLKRKDFFSSSALARNFSSAKAFFWFLFFS
jgi:hypothetical protein